MAAQPVLPIKTAASVIEFLASLERDKVAGITCRGRNDGVGAQAMAIISTQLFCADSGVPYFHTPFDSIKFADDQPDWEGRWEAFLNLGMNESPVPQGAKVVSPEEYIADGRPTDVVIAMNSCHAYTQADGTATALERIRPVLRQKYYAGTSKPQLNDHHYVAIHVRRGDVSEDNRYRDRFTTDDLIIERTARVLGSRIGTRPVHLFSQGDPDSFGSFGNLGPLSTFLDMDLFETLHRMVCAETLIACKSTLSYLAGLISENEVRAETWYHRPLPDWYFDDQKLEVTSSQSLFTDPAGTVRQLEENRDLMERSDLLKWNYAQSLFRSDRARSWDALEAVACSDTMYSRAAASTFCNGMAQERSPDHQRLEAMRNLVAMRFGAA